MLEGETTNNGFIYNTDADYVQEIQYQDLDIETMVFTGFKVAGTGLIISLLVLGVLSILKRG